MPKKKIPCLVIIYREFDIIKRCVDFLSRYTDRLDLIVLENRSPATDLSIKPYLLKLVSERLVNAYYLFHRNIAMNAFEVVLQSQELNLESADFAVVSDGDLVVEQGDWLGEQEYILDKHPEVFACGMTLDMRNLPVQAFPNATNWVDRGVEAEDYRLASTGLWLLMLRAKGLLQFVQYHKNHSYPRFGDSLLRKYSKRVRGDKWAATKHTKAYHLTWDRYADRNDPYTKIKTSASFQELFGHHRYCGFTCYTGDSITTHFPLRIWLRGLRRGVAKRILT